MKVHSGQRKGFSLIELMIVVLFLAALTTIAIPRVNLSGIRRREAETTTMKMITSIRRTRSMAISKAATHPHGFAFKLNLKNEPCTYQIVDQLDNSVIDSQEIDTDITVSCKGNGEYPFGPLGNLENNAKKEITVSAEGREFEITIEAGGTVKWEEK